jgi:hypothetical protein
MSEPTFLTIKRFVCHSTSDFTGSDDVVGVMGPRTFVIGSFEAGKVADLDIQENVPVGVRVLKIIERDLTGDDVIGTIDLTQDMDVDVTRNVRGDDADYDITLFVSSTSSVDSSPNESEFGTVSG